MRPAPCRRILSFGRCGTRAAAANCVESQADTDVKVLNFRLIERQRRALRGVGISIALLATCGGALAQQQTTDQLPLPQGQAKTQSNDKRWLITFDSDLRYFAMKQTSPTVPGFIKTQFLYAPISLQFAAIPNDDWKVELGVRAGRIDLTQKSSTGAQLGYTGWTDTTVNGTLTYYGFNGFQPFFALAGNLPTGNSFVKTPIVNVPQDPDVTQVNGFGEGLNVGPTIGVNIPITPDFIATLSLGHTIRGDFTRLGPNLGIAQPGFGPQQRVSPGDVTSLSASLGYQSGRWSFQGSTTFAFEGVTKVDGINFFQTGGKFSLAGAVGYGWTDALSSKLSASFTHTGSNRVPVNAILGNFGLHTETFNSNSNVFSVSFDNTYRIGSWAMGPTVSYLYRDHNSYDSTWAQFVPAKTKWSAGGTVVYAATDSISLNIRAEHYWVKLNRNPGAAPPVPQLDTMGWLVSVGGKVQF